ncbi:helix-turn-helix domain-containing protein [Niabella beijingensis]|uniref:helix-turn-helix domain-containing protein n=1 Tax=Niabella beijingensis TaxID=2872700 RepID=UPI001CBB24E5|nr:helix-turn-helix domain-containing protein [Niabella beijingensis]MBZ4187605.1 helix-turn-helix domain-containing protein [Niabella beijingensis]
MEIVVLTKADLEAFGRKLIEELSVILSGGVGSQPNSDKKWYKPAEVRKLLGISSGKLQQLRINGTLQSSKIGGVHYYQSGDIDRMFRKGMRSVKADDHG